FSPHLGDCFEPPARCGTPRKPAPYVIVLTGRTSFSRPQSLAFWPPLSEGKCWTESLTRTDQEHRCVYGCCRWATSASRYCRRFEVPTPFAASTFRNFKSKSGTRNHKVASALPKFVLEPGPMGDELRKRGHLPPSGPNALSQRRDP